MANDKTALWQVRPFGDKPGDLELVNGWRETHGAPAMPATVVPPLALVAELDGEPRAFGALYQSYGVGVCNGAWFTSRPGLALADAADAIGHVLGGLCAMTKSTHRLILGSCSKVIARMVKRYGFSEIGHGAIQVMKIIE